MAPRLYSLSFRRSHGGRGLRIPGRQEPGPERKCDQLARRLRERHSLRADDVDRALLFLPQVFDEHHTLRKLRLALFEVLDFLDDRVQTRGFLLRGGNVPVELYRLAREAPVAPTDEQAGHHQDQAAANGQLLTRLKRQLLLGLRALGGEKVDANHRSPALLSARPTATAAVGAMLAGS